MTWIKVYLWNYILKKTVRLNYNIEKIPDLIRSDLLLDFLSLLFVLLTVFE